LLAILMAMAMRQYLTTHIAQTRRFRASTEATGRRHRASIAAVVAIGHSYAGFSMFFHRQLVKKGLG
jgi:hypothetical protein